MSNLGESNCLASEYAEQLRNWLNQAYQWQCLPYLSLCPPPITRYPSNGFSFPIIPPSTAPNQPPIARENSPTDVPRAANAPSAANVPSAAGASTTTNAEAPTTTTFNVPKLSKRLFAEVIDFGLLFLVKAIITITILDTWYLEDADYYENEDMEDEDAYYEFAMSITANYYSVIMTIELFHRFLVVCYEAWFTLRGGATPGKRAMGLRIISCNKSIPIGDDRVLVEQRVEITVWKAMLRAFLKNMGTALLFPTYMPLMFVQQNRTMYDIMCGTIVVECD